VDQHDSHDNITWFMMFIISPPVFHCHVLWCLRMPNFFLPHLTFYQTKYPPGKIILPS